VSVEEPLAIRSRRLGAVAPSLATGGHTEGQALKALWDLPRSSLRTCFAAAADDASVEA